MEHTFSEHGGCIYIPDKSVTDGALQGVEAPTEEAMGCGASQPQQYRNGAPPVAVAQRPMEVVTVPAGVVGGQQLMLQMPSGSTRQVVVPAGLKAGDKFRVAAPGSGPPVPMGKPVPPCRQEAWQLLRPRFSASSGCYTPIARTLASHHQILCTQLPSCLRN